MSYIISTKRTPIGSFCSQLLPFAGAHLQGITIKQILQETQIDPQLIDEVILGNVLTAGQGQNPAKQSSVFAKLNQAQSYIVNKSCASGMKSIILAHQSICMKQTNLSICGGYESMSNSPYYLRNHRKGKLFTNDTLVDSIQYDGLTDVFMGVAMGVCAEKTNRDLQITRQELDAYTIQSYKKAIQNQNYFQKEIVQLEIKNQKITQDEEYLRFDEDKVLQLKPSFKEDGLLTVASSGKINDGACAVLLASEEYTKQLGVKPLAKVISYGEVELDSIDFCLAPISAAQKALKQAKLNLKDINQFEIHEQFATVPLAFSKQLKVDLSKINLNGGALSIGNPLGMSGARIVQSLANSLIQQNQRYGLAAIANGGGGASAVIIEKY